MGWDGIDINYKENKEKRKDLIIKYAFNNNTEDILHIEQNGNNVWVAGKSKDNDIIGELYITKIENQTFWYKEMSIDMCPFYYNCSKKFLELVKQSKYYKTNELAQKWFEAYKKENTNKKNKQKLIKELKIGDKIRFLNVDFGGLGKDKIWTITNKNDNKIYFDNCKLKGWKKYEFEKVF